MSGSNKQVETAVIQNFCDKKKLVSLKIER